MLYGDYISIKLGGGGGAGIQAKKMEKETVSHRQFAEDPQPDTSPTDLQTQIPRHLRGNTTLW